MLFPVLTGDNIKISINECVSDVPISKRQTIFNGFQLEFAIKNHMLFRLVAQQTGVYQTGEV